MHGSIGKHPAPAGDDAVAAKKTTRRRKNRKSRKVLFSEKAKHIGDTPDRVRSVLEWAAINGISEDTARRILASGKGPLSSRPSRA
jgi:hypothetical protein